MSEEKLGWQFLPLDGADMPTALLTNQIDGFLHSEPTTTIALSTHSGVLFMSGHNRVFGAHPPPMTFLMGRRDFVKEQPDAVRRFLAALAYANGPYTSAPKEKMIPLITQWSGTKPALLEVAYPRINPQMSMTHEQAENWWNYVGIAMISRGEISDKLRPFKDVFELDYQSLPKT